MVSLFRILTAFRFSQRKPDSPYQNTRAVDLFSVFVFIKRSYPKIVQDSFGGHILRIGGRCSLYAVPLNQAAPLIIDLIAEALLSRSMSA